MKEHTQTTACVACYGTGDCGRCHGEGPDPESGAPDQCRECNGTGICTACCGTGDVDE